MYRLIFFDLDGTLYDLRDTIRMAYQLQVAFLARWRNQPEAAIEAFLAEHGIFPYKSPDSKSATELFAQMGIDGAWTAYRDEHFDVARIRKSEFVDNELIAGFKRIAELVLVSSNTYQIIGSVLERLQIDPSNFSEILCSDRMPSEGPFEKKKAYRTAMEKRGIPACEVIAIGDRYNTDIAPLRSLGGDGILVSGPQDLKRAYEDLVRCAIPNEGSSYRFFRGIRDKGPG